MTIEELVERIEANRYDEKQLINLYNNANANNELSEEDKESLIEAIEKNTRLRFPRAAKRIFGAKESVATEMLEKLYSKISATYDLTHNRLKNGVKTGGLMISGKLYIEVYISYKNADNQGVFLSLTQDTVDDELVVIVRRYSTHKPESGVKGEKTGGIDRFDEFSNVYEEYLKEIL
ncbi:hypothetical protein [Zhongshania aliphaticivorans]|uniref:hypothetical protein n=1 Tax=Zhongshania aliphaticivorans TaxID=1470434 RepID=UPI0012E673EB|nr:hypothetical protein [Zhongshania aliphaticivorans]CAA0120441.1 Uncharacterised protein [Zhongshania aliphaticivorans]